MDKKETGIAILFIGAFFFIMGFILLLDKALMAAGNILIIVGTIILADTNIIEIFKPKNIQGTITFIFGVFVLFKKHAFLGFMLEGLGLSMLFYDKIPTFKSLGRKIFMKALRFIK